MTDKIEMFDDLHDSSLIDLIIKPDLTTVEFVLSAPTDEYSEKLVSFVCSGVLRFEFETTGSGISDNSGIPIEIYDVYNDKESEEFVRWENRIKLTGKKYNESKLYCMVFASSFIRGWGKRDNLEGIIVICQDIEIKDATKKYRGSEYKRFRIEDGDG